MVLFFQGQSNRIGDADGILPMLKMSAAAICMYLQRCLAPLKGRCLTLRKKHWPHSASATHKRSFWIWWWTFASGLFACVDHSPHANERSTSCLRVQYILPHLIRDLSLTISVYLAVFLPKAYLSNAIKPMCKTRAICSSKPTSDRAFKINSLLALCFDHEACVLNLIEYK